MSRFRTFFLVSAAVVLGACSDTQPPTSPSDSDAAFRKQGSTQSSQQVTAGVKRGAALELQGDIGAEHVFRTCNRLRTECITIYHSGNFVSRVLSQAAAQGRGCSRVQFIVNGNLRALSSPFCHIRVDQLFAYWYPRRRFPFGSRFCSDWRLWSGSGAPPGFACQNF